MWLSTLLLIPPVDAVVIDGPAIVNMVQPKNNCTVDKYCEIYMKYVVNFFNKTNRIDIVFNVYLKSSLKGGVLAWRGVASTMTIKSNTKIKSWKQLLKNNVNELSLFLSIAEYAKSMVLEP